MKKIILITLLILLQNGLSAQSGSYANVNGVKLYYEIYGTGQPLVLLHNFTASHQVWKTWLDSLSQDYQLIIPDLRGHGNSTNPSKKFRHEDSARDIYALMDELDIKKFKAIGASSGGMTLTHMATMDSTRIISMILVGSTSFFPDQTREIQMGLTPEAWPEDWLSSMKALQPGGDQQIKMLMDQFKSFAFSYDDMNFTAPYLSQIKCPTLIIHGDSDSYFPVEIPVESFKAIPNSFLWIIPNGGHLPIWDALWSDKFLEVSKLFLADKF